MPMPTPLRPPLRLLRTAMLASAVPVMAALVACGESAKLPSEAGFGPTPQLPPPNQTAIPTVKIAPAIGWAAGQRPVAA